MNIPKFTASANKFGDALLHRKEVAGHFIILVSGTEAHHDTIVVLSDMLLYVEGRERRDAILRVYEALVESV